MSTIPAASKLSPTSSGPRAAEARPGDELPSLTVRRTIDREDATHPLEWRLVLRLYRTMVPYRTKVNWLILLVMLRSIQLPALTFIVAAVIKGPVAAGDSRGVTLGAVAFTLLALTTQLVMHFRQRLALELGEDVVYDLRRDLFAHLQRLPMGFYHTTRLGRIISRMTSDIENVRVGVQEVLFVTIVQLGQMAVAAAVMLWYDRMLFALVLLIAPALYFINRHFHIKLSRDLREVQESFSRVTSTLAESVNGIRVTQGFVRQETNSRVFGKLVADHSLINLSVTRTQGLFLPLLDLNSQAFIAALLLLGGYQVLHTQTADVGDLVGFFFMAAMFFSPITVLGNQYNQALTAMAGAERLYRLLDTPPAWSDAPDAQPLPAIAGRVEAQDVVFGYDPERPVLHGVSFVAEPGQTIALVGATGSGKTTITNLIARFYLLQQGSLTVDGHDLRAITGDSLHRQLGIVSQQNYLFSGSVADNIRYGRPAASDEEVRLAAQQLDCFDIFNALPKGFDTEVGERGCNLSLGQRQLVCFARAMLADPRILILDEATSSVDTLTEMRIQRALEKLLTGRTSFVVAHRLSTIKHADSVLVLENGRIVERGAHLELMAAGGVYAGLYRAFAAASAA